MKVYKCILTDDEMFTDSFKVEETETFYKIKAKNVSLSNKVDESAFGANPSAEDAAEGTEDTDTTGLDVAVMNRLEQQAPFGAKKAYAEYFKDFVKSLEAKVKEDNPDIDLPKWKKNMQDAFKEACGFIKDADCYIGQSGAGLVALVNWVVLEGETDDTPFFYFYKGAIKEEKF